MIDWRTVIAVFAGGGIGSACRYLLGVVFLQRFGPGFPYGTMTINLLGCLLTGVISEFALSRSIWITPLTRSFLVAGVLGGFTTFSSFAYESVTMADGAAAVPAIAYVAISVGGGFLAAFAGMALVRSFV